MWWASTRATDDGRYVDVRRPLVCGGHVPGLHTTFFSTAVSVALVHAHHIPGPLTGSVEMTNFPRKGGGHVPGTYIRHFF